MSDLRTRIHEGDILWPHYAHGILRAADTANHFGHSSVTVAEFGVGDGAGLDIMTGLARAISAETGVTINVVGFESGNGLPAPQSYKDHPELWVEGDFKPQRTRQAYGRAIVWGDIAVTGRLFFDYHQSQSSPLGFAAIDVDMYSSAKAVLDCFLAEPDRYTPAVSLYFDDVTSFFSNQWCGELAAIEEFNQSRATPRHAFRKIDLDRSLVGRPRTSRAFSGMRVLHILDHPRRNIARSRSPMSLAEHRTHGKDCYY